jgi:hypothetical protein
VLVNESVAIVHIAHIRSRTIFLHFSWEAYSAVGGFNLRQLVRHLLGKEIKAME